MVDPPDSELPPKQSSAAVPSRVEQIFLGWLAEKDLASDASFESLCREHVEEAAELRRVRGWFRDARGALGASAGTEVRDGGAEPHGATAGGDVLAAGAPNDARSYEVRGEIARGGMGVVMDVWDARLRRSLAMKLPRDDLPPSRTPSAIRRRRAHSRFVHEAQVLAQLDHPGVVPIHDLGTDASGRPYFTMRKVRGSDLAQVIRAHHSGDAEWTLPRLVSVLVRVCEVMAFAHSKGVIHRDLKPENVMVGRFGEVYVMDWGLSKVIGSHSSAPLDSAAGDASELPASGDANGAAPTGSWVHTVREVERDEDSPPHLTQEGDVVGTPHYMSPEQAAGRSAAIDERSDVYAVGAMLYHVLAGRRPYGEDPATPPRELVARVTERTPQSLSRAAPAAPAELVSIADKAMERDAARRYPDAGALANDLRAWLEGRVVHAHESGRFAELRKWVRRNPALAATAGIALLATIVGLGGIALVESRRKDQLELENQKVVSANASSEEVIEFLIRMFESEDPDVAQGKEIAVATVLDGARERVRTELVDQPRTRARLAAAMGRVYLATGEYAHAGEMLELAEGLFQDIVGPGDAATLECGRHRALVEQAEGRLEAAHARLRGLADRSARDLGAAHLETLELTAALAQVSAARFLYSEAEPLFRRAAEGFDRELGASSGDALAVRIGWAETLTELGRYDEARTMLESAIASYRTSGRELTHDGLHAKLALARCRLASLELTQALELYQEVVDAQRARLAPGHTDLLTAIDGLAMACISLNRFAEAEALLNEVCAAYEHRDHTASDLLLSSLTNLGTCLFYTRRYDEAHDTLERARAMLAGVEKPVDDFAVLGIHNQLLMSDLQRGRVGEAREHAEPLIRAFEESRTKLDVRKLTLLVAVALVHSYSGDIPAAVAWLERVTAEMAARGATDHADYMYARFELGRGLAATRRWAEACDVLGEVVQYHRAGERSANFVAILIEQRYALSGAGRTDEALAMGREAIQISRELLPAGHPLRVRAGRDFIDVLIALELRDEALALIDEMLAEVGPDDPLGRQWVAARERLKQDGWTEAPR